MSFTTLLISLCTIQGKALIQDGYEKTKSWTNIATDVPCRKDSVTKADIKDETIRVNTDDDIFFFNPGVSISRGNRILFGTEYYDVIKVNNVYDSSAVHHLEVVARLIDNE
jgi:hypothetical protein